MPLAARFRALFRLACRISWVASALWLPLGRANAAACSSRLLSDTTAAPLMRFPQVHGPNLVFVARGNLWVAPRQGGHARRLTQHAGQDLVPHYSPDGRWLAFSSTWHGDQQVYVLPASGGRPRQLTFRTSGQPVDNLVLSWTPDSRGVVFASQQLNFVGSRTNCRPYQVPVGGGLPTPLPLGHTGLLSYGPGGQQLVYASTLREFEARKRYNGGQAPDIFTYDLRTHQRTQLTNWVGTDTAPLWFGQRIYFLSDRDSLRRLNLWVYDQRTRQTRAVTHFRDFDIDFPALGDGAISFQQGGKLYLLDLPSERLHEVTVQVPDDGSRTAPRLLDATPALRATDYGQHPAYALSPTGEQLYVAARGDVFAIATRTGTARNLTQTSTADEEYPACSPDGRQLAYISDANGEQQVVVRPLEGGPGRTLTTFAGGYFYQPQWSPHGHWLAVTDGEHRLWLVPSQGGAVHQVALDPYAEIHELCFSPDERWLVFGTQRPNQQRGLLAYELATARTITLSSPWNSDAHPAFAPDGQHLYFVSNRHEYPVLSERENTFTTQQAGGLYVVPWPGGSAANPAEHLLAQARPLPVAPATITAVEARPGGWLFYQTEPTALISGTLPGSSPTWHAFALASQQDQVIAADFDHGVLTADGQRLLYYQQDTWQLAPTPLAPASVVTQPLHLPALPVRSVPRQEWATMFAYAWRLERDLYYSPTLTGNDWAGLRARYARLLPQLSSRADLIYLLQQLLGELASSHLYLGPGPGPVPRPLALLGVDYQLDTPSRRYRLATVYPGDPARPRYRSPLAELAVPGRAGEFLLAINGHELRAPVTPDSLLLGLTGPVTLRLAVTATGPSREVVVQPVQSERALREQAWLERTRTRVTQLSQGRVGYVYLSDFLELGAEQFVRQYYPQLDKPALLFDVRWNTGGFTSQLLLERLRRQPVAGFLNRQQAVESLPGQVPPAALATLINAFTNSDADQFPYFFRQYGLGQVVGARTEGGVRGFQARWPLLDGANLTAPKDALFRADGQWVIENVGTTPDVSVEEDPAGVDEQDAPLAAAVQLLLQQLPAAKPRLQVPSLLPAYPAGGQVSPAH